MTYFGFITKLSDKTRGVKINEAWYNADEDVYPWAKDLGLGSRVKYEMLDMQLLSIEDYFKSVTPTAESAVALKKPVNDNIRMSALKSAVAYIGNETDFTPEEVLNVARKFEDYLSGADAQGGN